MAELRNVRRCLVEDGRPLAPGVLAIGDAAIHTNPLYGRGCTLRAASTPALLADALRAHGDDPVAAALALEARREREIVPWYKISRRAGPRRDRGRGALAPRRGPRREVARGRRRRRPEELPALADSVHGLVPALARDADVSRAFFRSFNLLDPPGDLLKDPAS